MSRLEPPFSADHRLLADALVDDDALRELLHRQPSEATFELIACNRLAPLIARRAAGLDAPDELSTKLRKALLSARVRWTLYDHELRNIGRVLAEHDIEWLPLKGGDLAFRVYERPDDRVASDLDVLVPEAQFMQALDTLLDDGWKTLQQHDPLVLRYVIEEGHNWPIGRGPVPLELHLRLWGRVPARMAGEMLEAAAPAPDLGPTGRCARLEHAFVVAGVHSWMVLRPRPIATWWDLDRIAASAGAALTDKVIAAARRWGLQLQVGMASAVAAALWHNGTLLAIAAGLLPPRPLPERAVLRRLYARGVDAVDDRLVVLARLLSGRPSRLGWLSVWRRLRPHPGIRALAASRRMAERPRVP